MNHLGNNHFSTVERHQHFRGYITADSLQRKKGGLTLAKGRHQNGNAKQCYANQVNVKQINIHPIPVEQGNVNQNNVKQVSIYQSNAIKYITGQLQA